MLFDYLNYKAIISLAFPLFTGPTKLLLGETNQIKKIHDDYCPPSLQIAINQPPGDFS